MKTVLRSVLAVVFAAALCLMALPSSITSAHHPLVSGSAVCNTDGNWDLSWVIANSEAVDGTNRKMTINSLSRSVGIAAGTTVAPSSSVTGHEILPGTENGQIKLIVNGSFDNGGPGNVTSEAVINLPTGGCTPKVNVNSAWLQTSVICESRTYDVTVVVTNGEKAKDISDVPMHGMLSDKALDFAVTTVFKNGKPASITFFNVHIPAWNESGCATATPTPSATPTASVTPSVTPTKTEEPSLTPEPSVTPSASPTPNCGEEDETQICTPTVSPTPSTTPSATPTHKPTLTVTPTPGNPDQGECDVANSANFPPNATGGDGKIWWNMKEKMMDNGKLGWAVQVFFPDANVAGKSFPINYGGGSQTVVVKKLDAPTKERCSVDLEFVMIPFATVQPLVMDMGEPGGIKGESTGTTAVVDGKPLIVEKFLPEGIVSQAAGVLAVVKTTGRTFYGWHYTDLQRKLEVGAVVTIGKKTYLVKASWEIEKNEILNLPKGTYGVSCTPNLEKNEIYQLELVN